jgi:hypothetical protein
MKTFKEKKERCDLDNIEFCDKLNFTPHLIIIFFTIKIKSRPH